VESRDPLFGIMASLNISGTVQARNSKFGIENDDNVY